MCGFFLWGPRFVAVRGGFCVAALCFRAPAVSVVFAACCACYANRCPCRCVYALWAGQRCFCSGHPGRSCVVVGVGWTVAAVRPGPEYFPEEQTNIAPVRCGVRSASSRCGPVTTVGHDSAQTSVFDLTATL